MGRSRYKISEDNRPYFLTCTVVNWMPLFTRPSTAQIVLDALAYLQEERRLVLYGYVLLENHLHLIAQANNLGREIGCFKSYTGRMVIRYLHDNGAAKVLDQLAFRKLRHKKDRQHQVWQEGAHPQLLQNEVMVRQKLEYIHNNPVKRGYVDEAVHWRYSSARNYAGLEGLLPVFTGW